MLNLSQRHGRWHRGAKKRPWRPWNLNFLCKIQRFDNFNHLAPLDILDAYLAPPDSGSPDAHSGGLQLLER